jgi:lysophospholipase L1-like esterase
MNHVVLLGDSVFDNGVYVPGQPAVIDLVQSLLPKDWKATLLAVDGSVTTDALRQLDALPTDASHLVLSVGGNDAFRQMGILSEPAHSVAEALDRLATMGEQFSQSYSSLLETLLSLNLPKALCTIYNPVFPDPVMQRLAITGLMIFNDVIIRLAAEAGVPFIDLRLVCSDEADYANPIEPSAIGGAKIAARIVQVVTRHNFGDRRTVVFT